MVALNEFENIMGVVYDESTLSKLSQRKLSVPCPMVSSENIRLFKSFLYLKIKKPVDQDDHEWWQHSDQDNHEWWQHYLESGFMYRRILNRVWMEIKGLMSL